jgi:tRNA dimethylallyltransferase
MNIPTFNSPTLLVVTGPTAVGKTAYTIGLAQQLSTEIISADSRQFFKEMQIGTAFPTQEELNAVPHHFVGHLSIHDYYNVSMFEIEVLEKLEQLFKKHQVVVMTGGSGLYIDTVCHGIDDLPDIDPDIRKYVIELHENEGIEGLQIATRHLDPRFYETTDKSNYKRLMRALEVTLQTGTPYSQKLSNSPKKRPFDIVKYCLQRPREELFERINSRVDAMMESGLLEEVKELYPYKNLNSLNTVGYKELFDYLDGKYSLEKAVEEIKTHTRRYAKRQITWFKRDHNYNVVSL